MEQLECMLLMNEMIEWEGRVLFFDYEQLLTQARILHELHMYLHIHNYVSNTKKENNSK